MGTKIQANAFLRDYRSVIDLDGSTSNGIRSLYHENQITKNGQNLDSFTSPICKNGYLGYDPEKVRQMILEHESIFRYQLQELHRLYGRQRELMNEIENREIKNDDLKEEKSQLSSFFSPVTHEDAKRTWNARHSSSLHSVAGFLSTSGTSSKPFSSYLENKSVPVFPLTQETRSLRSLRSFEPQLSSIFPKGTSDVQIPADVYSTNTEKRMQERFSNHQASYDRDTKLSLASVQTSQCKADATTFDLCFKRTNHSRQSSIKNPMDGNPDRLALLRGEVSENSRSNFNLATKDFFPKGILGLRNERSGNEHMSDDYAEKRRFDKHSSVGDFCSSKSFAFPLSLSAEPRKEFSNCPLDKDTGASVSQRKRRLFGVEISDGNDDPFHAASNMSSTLDSKVGAHQENGDVVSFKSSSWIANSFVQNLELGGTNMNDGKNDRLKRDLKWSQGCASVGVNFLKVPYEHDPRKYFKNLDEMNSKPADFRSNEENPKGELPWFLRNSQVKTSSYFMNLDSLQNCSQKFFGRAEIDDGTKREGGANEVNEGTSVKKILGFPVSDRKIETDEDVPRNMLETKNLVLRKGLNDFMSDLRHHIDLNLTLDEEDAPSAPSPPTTIQIDLEAPAVIESEGIKSEECDKIAAEAIIAISFSVKKNLVDDDDAHEPPEARLKWFAEIISSQSRDNNGARDEEESIPDDMDYFEFMTLKLEETKEDSHHYQPFMLHNPSDDETRNTTLSKRSRRGQSRRGRQRKDFQRDILPGLVTLSRVEVTEDLQAFEELLKAKGGSFSQRSSTRNGRGRKRSGGQITRKETRPQQPVCRLGERSLTGWGKKTRRLPRQRCPTTILSFPVKC